MIGLESKRLLPVLFVVLAPGWRATPGEVPVVDLFVSASAPRGGDGSEESPLQRITDAVAAAVRMKAAGNDVRVIVGAGTYREGPIEFGYTNFPSNDPDNANTIEVTAATPGTVIISGADLRADWHAAADGSYWTAWDEDWGIAPNPWSADVDVPAVVLRRELVVVDGNVYRQVLRPQDLEPGTFRVDESAGRLWIRPGDGVDPSRAHVELGTRGVLWDQNHEDNVTIRGLVFEHAATPWQVGSAAVRISASDNVVIEDCEFRGNNWTGLYVGESNGVAINRSRMNDNGGQGWAMFRVKNVRVRASETSRNNWRGGWGGFTGWSIGNKILSAHGVRIVNHRATGNLSRGIWLDYDIADAVIDSSLLAGNLRDGIWIEASQGPVSVTRSEIRDNREAGIHATYAENVTVTRNILAGNAHGQIKVGGRAVRSVKDFETGTTYELGVQRWLVTDNTMESPAIRVESLTGSDWHRFSETLTSERNKYIPGTGRKGALFSVLGKLLGLDAWRALSRQDIDSEIAEPGAVAYPEKSDANR